MPSQDNKETPRSREEELVGAAFDHYRKAYVPAPKGASIRRPTQTETPEQTAARQRLETMKANPSWSQSLLNETFDKALEANRSQFPKTDVSARTLTNNEKPTPPPEPTYNGQDLKEIGRQYDADMQIVARHTREQRILGVIAATFLLLIVMGLWNSKSDIVKFFSQFSNPNDNAPAQTSTPTVTETRLFPTPTRWSTKRKPPYTDSVVLPPNSEFDFLVTDPKTGEQTIYAKTPIPK